MVSENRRKFASLRPVRSSKRPNRQEPRSSAAHLGLGTIYQATGRSYWLSPRLVGRIGLLQTRDRLSLGYLLDLMEDVQADVAALDLTRPDLPSIGVSGDIRVRPEQRAAFLGELQHLLQDLFTRYGGAEGDAFRLAVACYPNLTEGDSA